MKTSQVKRLRIRFWSSAGSLALAGALFSGCENVDPTLGPSRPQPNVPISLHRDVQPILTTNCAIPGCHDSATRQQNLVLESGNLYNPATGLVNVSSLEAPGRLRVAPGRPELSYMINKLEGTQNQAGGKGDRMPRGGPYLSGDTIQVIKDWINEGARNN
jgi:hypothetical protein